MTDWARNFQACRSCETNLKTGNHQHYSKGFCKSCYMQKFKTDEQREKQKERDRKRRQRIKEDPVYRAKYTERQKAWRLSPSYRKKTKKRLKRLRFNKFIKTYFEENRKVKGYKKFLTITVEYEDQQIKVPTPVTKILRNMADMNLFKRQVVSYLQRHPKSLPEQEWQSL